MCLAIPGRVVAIGEQFGQSVAEVDFDGTVREVVLSLVPEAIIGSYVIAHAGIAIQLLDEAAAAESLALFRDIGATQNATQNTAAQNGPDRNGPTR